MQILVPVVTAWTAAPFGDAPAADPADVPASDLLAGVAAPDWAR